MHRVIGMFDGGTTKIKHKGQMIPVGVIKFRMQESEGSAQIEVKGFYNPFFRKNVLRGLKHLHFIQEEKPPVIANEPTVIASKTKQSNETVIPAQAQSPDKKGD